MLWGALDNMGRQLATFILGLILGVFVTYGYSDYFAGPPNLTYSTKDAFGKGRMAVCTGNYQTGIQYLNDYMDANPNGRNAARAGLFKGKALLAQGEYAQSQLAFRQVIDTFPDSLEAHKCQYKMGLAKLFEGDPAAAVRIFQELGAQKNGPLTPEAEAFTRWLTK